MSLHGCDRKAARSNVASIRVKIKVLNNIQERLKLNNSQMAQRIGVDKTMLWRVKTGRSNPGTEFIAKFLLAFPEVKFEDIFSIE
jgi:DNA-binding XRE family transcriptional regulator